MTILVTGAAGFIGAAVSRALLMRGDRVVGIDNLEPYYDVALKHARIADIQAGAGGVGDPQVSAHPLDQPGGDR